MKPAKPKLKDKLTKEITKVLKSLHKDDALWDDGFGIEDIHPFESDAHADAIVQYAPTLEAIWMGDERFTETHYEMATKLYKLMFKKYVKDHKLQPPTDDDDEAVLDLYKRLKW